MWCSICRQLAVEIVAVVAGDRISPVRPNRQNYSRLICINIAPTKEQRLHAHCSASAISTAHYSGISVCNGVQYYCLWQFFVKLTHRRGRLHLRNSAYIGTYTFEISIFSFEVQGSKSSAANLTHSSPCDERS